MMLNVLRCQMTYQGQAETRAKAWFSIALRPQKPEGSLGRPPRLSHSSWTKLYKKYLLLDIYLHSSDGFSKRWRSTKETTSNWRVPENPCWAGPSLQRYSAFHMSLSVCSESWPACNACVCSLFNSAILLLHAEFLCFCTDTHQLFNSVILYD